MNIQTNISLSALTTMKIGGNANYVAHVTSRDELRQLYQNALRLHQPIFIMGGGSNLIAHDEGYPGIIAKMEIPGIEVMRDDEATTTIRAGAGVIWDDLVKYSIEHNLTGIDAMSGIPGTVGGAPVQNIGAYGQELSDTFVSLDAYDILADTFVEMNADYCDFSYRHSTFRGESQGKYVILSVTLKLSKQLPQPPFYDSLQKRFDQLGVTSFTPQIVRENVLAIRTEKLPDPSVIPNSGSFFKNVIIERWKLDEIRAGNPEAPAYEMEEGLYKVPAGWLIQESNLRGEEIDGFQVYDKNAVVLTNVSATTYKQLSRARKKIVGIVRDQFQIVLEQEPLELVPPTPDKK